jgi:hypothetical protein
MGEFLSNIQSYAQQQLQATGAASMGGVLGVQGIAGQVFGADSPLAQGGNALDFTGRLQSVFTERGSPLQVHLMRAMGYGREGGPGYVEMRKRMDAGLNDPRNLMDLFGSMQGMGMGEAQMFRAVESVAGGTLKAHEIESLVKGFDSPEELSAYRARYESGTAESLGALTGSMSAREAETVRRQGFAAAGAGTVSQAEAMAVQMEGMQMAVGGTMAQVIMDMRDALQGLMGAFTKITGLDIGKLVTDFSGAVAGLGDAAKQLSSAKEMQGSTLRGADFLTNPGGYEVVGEGVVPSLARSYKAGAGAASSAAGTLFAPPDEGNRLGTGMF